MDQLTGSIVTSESSEAQVTGKIQAIDLILPVLARLVTENKFHYWIAYYYDHK